jgi:hypothetical protein
MPKRNLKVQVAQETAWAWTWGQVESFLLLLLIGHVLSTCSLSVHRAIGVKVHSVDLGGFARTNYVLYNQLNAMFRILTLFSDGSTQGNTEK